jgi:hypothetical protein
MQSAKLMFLGFLVILVGLGWLISLQNAVVPNSVVSTNPLVQLFIPDKLTGDTTNLVANEIAPIIRAQEAWAFVLLLGGLAISTVGYFRK